MVVAKYLVSRTPLSEVDSSSDDFPEQVLVFNSQDDMTTYFRLKASQMGYPNMDAFFKREEYYLQKIGNSVRIKGMGH